MSRIRDLMRDKRVAAGVAVAAVLFSAYRIAGVGKGKEPPPVSGAAPAGPSQAVGIPQAGEAAPAPNAPPSALFPAEVAWSWDRNPFLPKGAHGPAPGAGAVAFGDDGRKGERPEGRENGDLPGDLRGTVVSGNSGLAIFGTRLVPRGDRVGGWTLERVEHARVVLRRGTEERVLEIFKPAPR